MNIIFNYYQQVSIMRCQDSKPNSRKDIFGEICKNKIVVRFCSNFDIFSPNTSLKYIKTLVKSDYFLVNKFFPLKMFRLKFDELF